MADSSKRNYIRRKKYMNDSYEKIRKTLDFINLAAKLKLSEQEISKKAMTHAQAIEAACWSPHLRLTASEYEDLTAIKTTELCRALTKQYLPHLIPPAQANVPQPNDASQDSSPSSASPPSISNQIPKRTNSAQIGRPAASKNPNPVASLNIPAPNIGSLDSAPNLPSRQTTCVSPGSFRPAPKYPIPMALNRPLTPHCFPIPIFPKSAPQNESINSDFGISDFDRNFGRNTFVPSFEQDPDPFHDQFIEPLDTLPPFDDSIDDIFNLDMGRVGTSLDSPDYVFKF